MATKLLGKPASGTTDEMSRADVAAMAVRFDATQSLTAAQQAQARQNIGFTRTAVSDTAYTALASDSTVAFTALTAARTLTLPAASTYPIGSELTVVDESGNCSATNTVTVTRTGSDTINGATTSVISTAYGYLVLESNGASKWTIVDSPPVASLTRGQVVALALGSPF